MSDENDIEEEFGLDTSMDEALQRFGRVTKDELAGVKNLPAKIPNGELELVPFKTDGIRRVCHYDEWWYSVVDVVTALTGSDRGRKYWSDLKAKMIEKEGFSELSDEIGQLPSPRRTANSVRPMWRPQRRSYHHPVDLVAPCRAVQALACTDWSRTYPRGSRPRNPN